MTVSPRDLQQFYKPFQWQEPERVNPQLHYKSPLVSRRLNINHVTYDPSYYSMKPEKMENIQELKSKSIVFQDYMTKRGMREEEREQTVRNYMRHNPSEPAFITKSHTSLL